jgi:hypothetical protein
MNTTLKENQQSVRYHDINEWFAGKKEDFDIYLCTSAGIEHISTWIVQAASFVEYHSPLFYRLPKWKRIADSSRRKRLSQLSPATEFFRAICQARHLECLKQYWNVSGTNPSFLWQKDQRIRAAEILSGFDKAERCGRVNPKV